MMEIKGLNVSYDKKQIIFDLSMTIETGDRLLVAGPNGAGKSTLMQALAGLIPAQGTVLFQGRDISGDTACRRVKDGIVYLLQTGNIVPSLSVAENLLLAGHPRTRREVEPEIDTVMGIFPFLGPKTNTRSGFLSGGERQALAIGMVLLKRPSLLLLDEPSAGLSPKAAADILASVSRAQETFGIKTVCMIEHRLREALSWASRLVVLTGGRTAHDSSAPAQYIDDPKRLEQFFF